MGLARWRAAGRPAPVLIATAALAATVAATDDARSQAGGEGNPAAQAERSSLPVDAPLDASNPATTPVGVWRTVDDLSGKPRSLVRIRPQGSALVGEVVGILDTTVEDAVCQLCPGDRKDKPVLGLQIIRGLKRFDDRWADGRILNPEDGKIYTLRALPVDGGRKLEVRGYIGMPLLGRTQTWIREE